MCTGRGAKVADRRGEAHLWLLLEETLATVVRLGRPGDGASRHDAAWEARRNYDYVAGALAASGAVAPAVAAALIHELEDALVVRGLAQLANFAGRPFPVDVATAPRPSPPGGPEVWLEAEIERHLGLLATLAAGERRGAGEETLRILAGPVRGLTAAGAGEPCAALVEQMAASLEGAGFDTGANPSDPLVARPEWVRFLHERPIPVDPDQPPIHSRKLREPLGELAGRQVLLVGLAWSSERVEASFAFGPAPQDRAGEEMAALAVRALDDRGRLHLGQAAGMPSVGGPVVHLRPGLDEAAASLVLRVTAGGECVTAAVVL